MDKIISREGGRRDATAGCIPDPYYGHFTPASLL